MWPIKIIALLISLHLSDGCQMEGVATWFVPVVTQVVDVQRGVFFSRSTTNILNIESVTNGEGLRGGPYVEAAYEDSIFTISTNNEYPQYEENEVSSTMALTIVFGCTGGSTATLVFQIDVTDTNNNAPQTSFHQFTLTPPLPPGFQITGCLGDIIARDIDLTTRRVDFEIEDNPYFMIEYDEASTIAQTKEFKASLKTTTLIRSIPEPIELTITATDVDDTGDPPITTYSIIRIEGDNEFQLPEEPIFSKPFYLGNYTADQVELEVISLQQGYHETVHFGFESEFAEHFELLINGNALSITVTSPLSPDTFGLGQMVLVITAERDYTSGATTTVILQLPQARELEFESNIYIGSIHEDILTLDSIALSTGFNDDVNFYLEGDYASYFNTSNIQNSVTLNLITPLPANVLAENNHVTLALFASGEYTTVASTSVLLSILKQDDSSPVFTQNIYLGTYSEGALTIEDISLLQGHDDSVTFSLEGEHSDYFSMDIITSTISIGLQLEIPQQLIYDEKVLFFNVIAEKPLSVSASTVIAITFPRDLTEPTLVLFEKNTYIGSLDNTVLNLENIALDSGYTTETEFILRGDLAEYFYITNSSNIITVLIADSIPADVLGENKHIVLELYAEMNRTVSVPASIIIDIIEQEGETLIFEEPYYKGSYSEEFGLQFENNISLLQGYDDTVVFALEEDYSDLFTLSQNGNSVSIALNQSIDDEILRETNYFVFTIAAYRNGGTPAKAAIVIDLPEGTQDIIIVGFTQNSYVGSIDNGELNPPSITLLDGMPESTTLNLTGDFSSYFEIIRLSNNVEILLVNPLPNDIDSSFIILELEASYTESINAYTTIVLEMSRESSETTLVFEQPYYIGEYSDQDGLLFEHNIRLLEGFDESVLFTLSGDDSRWFSLVITDDSLSLNLTDEAINAEDRSYLVFSIVASKTNSVNGHTAIVIALQDVMSSEYLRFSQTYYKGVYEDSLLIMEEIRLETSYTTDSNVTITGDYSEYFQLTSINGTYTLEIDFVLPPEVTENNVLIFTLEARNGAEITYATLVIELKAENNVTSALEFDKKYYLGSYSEETNFVFDEEILLSSGYDDFVVFSLDGEFNELFEISATDNVIRLILESPIPQEVILNRHHLLLTINAEKSGSQTASSVIIISLTDENNNFPLLGFERRSYMGTFENNTIILDNITLTEGYTDDVTFSLTGDLSEYFNLTESGSTVSIVLQSFIPEEELPSNNIILLELQASATQAVNGYASIILKAEHINTELLELDFNQPFFVGNYSEASGFVFTSIILIEGYDDTVEISLDGEHAQWFNVSNSENEIFLNLISPIPTSVIDANHQLIYTVNAQKSDIISAKATIIVSLVEDLINETTLRFEKTFYIGKIENYTATIEPITLIEGSSVNVTFELTGELSSYLNFTVEEDQVFIYLNSPIPLELQPDNGLLILDLEASATDAVSAHTAVIFELVHNNITEVEVEQLSFAETYYIGNFTEDGGLNFNETITLVTGFDDTVEFGLDGDDSIYFSLSIINNSVTLIQSSSIPSAVLYNNPYLIFTVTALKLESVTASTTIVITLTGELEGDRILSFNRISFTGSIENDSVNIEPIVLSEGYESDVTFSLNGELMNYFNIDAEAEIIAISLQDSIPEEILNTQRVIVLEVQASAPQTMSAFATVVFEVIKVEVEIEQLEFNNPYYTGVYDRLGGLVMENVITLSHGYDEHVEFHLVGDNSEFFELNVNGNSVMLSLNNSSIPENILNSYLKLIFVIIAEKPNIQPARATIVISLLDNEQSDTGVSFDKILYQGLIQAGVVQHETIVISGYNGTDVHIDGEYSELFEASALAGSVIVVWMGSVTLAEDVNYMALEMRVANTSAVLILDVIHSGTPALPTVLFSSPSYIFRVDISQTGKIGQVEATADNGEQVSYSLLVQNEHLLQRLFVDEEGDVYLSAPANSGVYTFQVAATAIFTQVTGVAQVHLTVDAITTCGDDDYVVPPLIIIDRDEEEPHSNLVTLSEDLNGCWFNLSNRWPIDQTWLYVDDTGLHTTSIDREHESIAFMALSQVQVELTLICDTDQDATEYIEILNTGSVKQTTPTNIQPKLDSLGPYDYGNNKWVITDTILFNPRRTFVNLIVNDINDNYPIFEGKQSEPIVVGYPVSELEARVLPRALIALKATDADVGENASLVYWTSEDILAVSPTTGLVHVRDASTLTDGTTLTVYATDRDGEGLTGSLDLLVKMLDVSHIAVVTVRGAFLDDEETILSDLSAAVGYEVKALRSTVIADSEAEVRAIRRKRQTSTPAATLQIYVYGLVDAEPVDVDQLAADITNSAISTLNVVSTISLEDHLDNIEICGTGLLVATIVLSVLLFMLIVAAAVWFILLWRKKQNYDQFSDENSLASRNESLEQLPKPNPTDRPRLNIEELRRSEKRLQEMLDAPVEENMPKSSEVPSETVNISIPDQPSPIVIQSIDKLAGGSDDEDEFGETMKAKRKSVVTFNENVEKIIHVDDISDNDDNEFEIYKF